MAGPIYIQADPRIPKFEVDAVARRLLASEDLPVRKFYLEDPKDGWERVYAVRKTGEGHYRMSFSTGSSHTDFEAPDRIVSLTRFRIQQALGWRGRVFDPDVLPTYKFPFFAVRYRSGAHRIVRVPDLTDSDEARRTLQSLCDQVRMSACLVLDENHARYFEPGMPGSESTGPPPRGGIWLSPAAVKPTAGPHLSDPRPHSWTHSP